MSLSHEAGGHWGSKKLVVTGQICLAPKFMFITCQVGTSLALLPQGRPSHCGQGPLPGDILILLPRDLPWVASLRAFPPPKGHRAWLTLSDCWSGPAPVVIWKAVSHQRIRGSY